jgi:hypothetical protein
MLITQKRDGLVLGRLRLPEECSPHRNVTQLTYASRFANSSSTLNTRFTQTGLDFAPFAGRRLQLLATIAGTDLINLKMLRR